jgi:hypothetical protein
VTGEEEVWLFFWNNNIDCTITIFSFNHVDINVNDPVRGNWRLTGLYGYPEGVVEEILGIFLGNLCVIGDFNDILSSDEKKGRVDRANWLINGFREAVVDTGLFDLKMHGYQFTWFKSLGTSRAVEEKLDRALVNDTWSQNFPNSRLECLSATSSDHYPLWLTCDHVQSNNYVPRHFKFEMAWLEEPEFAKFVRHNWSTYNAGDIMHKLDECASDLIKLE